MEMMTAMNVLKENGIMAEMRQINKNGRMVNGMMFGGGDIQPTIYQDALDGFADEGDLVAFARETLCNLPDIDLGHITSRDYVLSHVQCCVRHATEDTETLKYPAYGDLEEYYRIITDDVFDAFSSSIVISRSQLEGFGIGEEEIRRAGRDNLRRNVEITPMADMLAELLGGDSDELDDIHDDFMFVATNKSRHDGAGVMLLEDVLDSFCRRQGVESIYIIPSSRHEVIIVRGDMDREFVDRTIVEVNAEQVVEADRLSDHGYEFRTGADAMALLSA